MAELPAAVAPSAPTRAPRHGRGARRHVSHLRELHGENLISLRTSNVTKALVMRLILFRSPCPLSFASNSNCINVVGRFHGSLQVMEE